VLINGNQVFLQTTITREVGRNDGYWSQDGYAAASDFKTLNDTEKNISIDWKQNYCILQEIVYMIFWVTYHFLQLE
jgi:hypothetical protein